MPTRCVRTATAVALVLVLGACAASAGDGSPDPAGPAPPAEDATVVLQVTEVGGYTTPALLTGRLPTVTLYADGRLITDGPVMAIWPAPALPNLQVHLLDDGGVRDLVDRALAAGVAGTSDLGQPPVTDVTTTRFAVRTGGTTVTREAYALGMDLGPAGDGEAGLTEEQAAARQRLLTFLDELRDPAAALGAERVTGPEPYRPEAVAALVSPYVEVEPAQPEQRWPGPELPGAPIAPDVTCVAASGAQAQALLEAAASASAATPWTAADGSRWSALLRPLLPHESGCADLPPA